jgi:hypothetical protein
MNITRRRFVGLGLGAGLLGAVAPSFAAVPAIPKQYGLSLLEVAPDASELIDNTDSFANAIDYASRNGLGTLFVPAGIFPLRKLVLRDSVKIVGAGRNATVLQALPSAEPGLVVLDGGPVRYSGLSGLTLRGGVPDKATNPGQWAMRLQGSAKEGLDKPHGGLWWSEVRDLAILSFDNGIFLNGGGKSYLLPNQFLTFSNIICYAIAAAAGRTLKIVGQNAQILFQQVQFDFMGGAAATTSVQVGGDSPDAINPSIVHFDVCTFQSARQAVSVRGAQNVAFTSCWFESNGGGIVALENAAGISIANSRFANTGDAMGAINFSPKTTGTVISNIFAGVRTSKTVVVGDSAQVVQIGNFSILGAAGQAGPNQ